MLNVDNRAFSIMIPLQILRKSDLVLYVWSDFEFEGEEDEVIAGMNYNYCFTQLIGYGILYYTLQ